MNDLKVGVGMQMDWPQSAAVVPLTASAGGAVLEIALTQKDHVGQTSHDKLDTGAVVQGRKNLRETVEAW